MRPRMLLALMAGLGLPAIGAAGQAPRQVTVRAEAGTARAYGGHYQGRDLDAFTLAVDVGLSRGGASGPQLGLGFTAYNGREATVFPVRCVPDAFGCGPTPANFPDVYLAFIDVGWRAMTHGFKADFLFQPTLMLLSRPDVFIVGPSAGVSVSHRIAGPVALEVGTYGTYFPSMHPDRIGLHQLTLGLRSW